MKAVLVSLFIAAGCRASVPDVGMHQGPASPEAERSLKDSGATDAEFNLAAPATPPEAAWTKLYEVRREDFGFGFVYVDGDTWFAPGEGVIVVGHEDGSTPTEYPMKNQFLQRIEALPNGALVAVGSPMVVAELEGARWLPHQVRAKPSTKRFGDILASIDHLQEDGQSFSVASGPHALVVQVGHRKWQAPPAGEVERLRGLIRKGPRGALCPPLIWRGTSIGKGFYVCSGGEAFFYREGMHEALPPIEDGCSMSGINVNDSGVAFICESGVKFMRFDGARGWSAVTPPEELHTAVLGSSCLYANSQRTIWRLCAQ